MGSPGPLELIFIILICLVVFGIPAIAGVVLLRVNKRTKQMEAHMRSLERQLAERPGTTDVNSDAKSGNHH